MLSQDLIKYIDIQLKRGLGWDKIKEVLLANGWTSEAIDENYNEVLKTTDTQPEPIVVPKQEEVIQPEAMPAIESPVVEEHKLIEEPKPIEQPMLESVKPVMERMAFPEATFEEPKQVKSNKKLIVISGIIAGIVLLIGGVAAGIYYYQAIVPQKVFYDAMSNTMKSVDANAMQAVVSIRADADVKEGVTLVSGFDNYKYFAATIDAQTSFDARSKDILKALLTGKIEISAKESREATDLVMSLADLELRTDNNTIYGSISDLQGMSNIYSNKEIADEYQQYFNNHIKSQWFSVAFPKDVNEESYYSVYRKNYDTQIESNTADYKKLSSYILEAFKPKLINSEKIETDDCYHYQVVIDQKGMWNLLKEYVDVGEDVTAEQWEAYEEDYNTGVWPIISKIKVEEWVTKQNPYIRKYSLSYQDNFDTDSSMPISIASVSASMIFKKLDTVAVSIPENVKDSSELSMAAENATSNYVLKIYLSQFATGVSDYKTKNGTYVGFISKGGGKAIIDDANLIGGTSAEAYTSKTKYCLAKELLGGDGIWCVDYNGFSGVSTNCKKETYSCK